MGEGLLVTELLGHGVNPVTGDYSRGAAGFWVENGEVAYPVDELTIAGNLSEMFKGVLAVGADVDVHANTRSGSVLIDRMTIARSEEHTYELQQLMRISYAVVRLTTKK